MNAEQKQPARGVVLTSAEAANEGVETILERLQRAGANAIGISPGVFVPVPPGEGVREPPLDVDGEERTLDRPLWGAKVQHLKGYSPHLPDPALWRDVPFPMPEAAPAAIRRDYAGRVIAAASARGMSTHIVTSPTLLPGLPGGQSFSAGNGSSATDHRVVRVDGSVAERAIAGQGCVNDPRIRALARARLSEVLRHYPEADGLFVDWAEYTCYLPQDIFTCFCTHCQQEAVFQGLPWADVKRACLMVLEGLGHVDDRTLAALIDARPGSIAGALQILAQVDDETLGLLETLERFKAHSVAEFYRWICRVIDDAGVTLQVGGNAFAPPWNQVTGSVPTAMSGALDVLRTKLFTFHWPMMTRWLGEMLLERNPGLTPSLVLAAAKVAYEVPTGADEHRTSLQHYQMPRPDEPHPITMPALRDKLNQVHAAATGTLRVEAYLHSYRPVDEFARLLEVPDDSGVWVQRYGYLSDEKLEVLASAWTHGGRWEGCGPSAPRSTVAFPATDVT